MRTRSRDFAVLLFDEVEALDVAAVARVASGAGRGWNFRPLRLVATALGAGLVETRSQLRLEATCTLADCPSPDLLLVPGGYGARRAASDATIVEWCTQVARQAELIAAIGAGSSVLAAAGLLDGCEVARPTPDNAWLKAAAPRARFSSASLVHCLPLEAPHRLRSGTPVITASDGADAVALGLSIVEHLLGQRLADSIRRDMGLATPKRALTLSF